MESPEKRGVVTDGEFVGMCAFRDGWVDHLYVHPAHHRSGIGAALLHKAKDANEQLQLWAFQRNENALRFYASQGFRLVKTTDGRGNEEREPDALGRDAAGQALVGWGVHGLLLVSRAGYWRCGSLPTSARFHP